MQESAMTSPSHDGSVRMINGSRGRPPGAEDEIVWGESGAAADSAAAPATLSGVDVARAWGLTLRTLRHYEHRGLIAPRRCGSARIYSPADHRRIGLIVKAKKLGFTLAEIGRMLDAGGELAPTAQQCLRQITRLQAQLKDTIEALAELRRIHLDICRKAGEATES
jgi:DNA-binding transcriptional MerR regulator